MKKALKTSLSLLLSLLMMFSIVTPAFAEGDLVPTGGSSSSSSTTNMPEYQMNMNFSTIDVANVNLASPTTSMFQNLCKGAISMVATRAVQEITSLLIKEDIPGLSKALVMMQDPASRAELQHKQLVQEMAKSVEEIKQSVDRIENQLKDISNKIDEYATAEALRDATTALNGIVSKYQVVWGNYQAVLAAGGTLSQLEDQYVEETSETEESTSTDEQSNPQVAAVEETSETEESTSTDEQSNPQVAAAEEALTTATNIFINSIDEGGGLSFLLDLQNIPGYLWNPADATSDYDTSYLGAYEAYLRERYPFEHQITSELYTAVDTCINIQLQMLLLYSEYYTYKKEANPTAYSSYTSEYFSKIQYGIIQNMAAMVESTGLGTYMRAEALKEDELTVIRKYDPNLIEPDNIDASVTINGLSYDAYKVRSNNSLDYFLIFKNTLSPTDVTKSYKCLEAAGNYPKQIIYRPEFIHNSLYTDDGRYKMISDISEVDFASSWTNMLSMLRDKNYCNLSQIQQTTSHILLYSYDYKGNGDTKSVKTWNVNLQNITDITADVTTVTAQNYYKSGTQQSIVIYKDMLDESNFSNDGTYEITDKGVLENRTIVITDGHKLDISAIELDVSNVTIFISGSGTIISNPNIELTDSCLIVCNTSDSDIVNIKNLNIVSDDEDEAALIVKSGCKVRFAGDNSFSGVEPNSDYTTSSESKIQKNYTTTRPMFASHGILLNGNVTLYGLTGNSVTAKGSYGGAGICLNKGNFSIVDLTVNATGSSFVIKNSAILTTVGAGIGSCVTYTVSYEGPKNTFDSGENYVDTDRPIISKGDSTINNTGTLTVIHSNITAETAEPYFHSEFVSIEDIGGVSVGGGYYCLKDGSITNSTITAKSASISDRITTSGNNNRFTYEIFTVETYTQGSNGVTTDGISFKFLGKDTSVPIRAENTGNNKGYYSETVIGSSVRDIHAVYVCTNSSNYWWPGEITISGKYSGETITVYGGRWIGSSGALLSPDDNIYKVTVNTGTAANSGTDAGIYLQLQDADSTVTSNVNLSDIHQDSNAFEKGDTDVFWIYAPYDFGECTHAKFYSDNSNAASGWLLDSFTIEKVQGSDKDNDKFTVYSGQWFEEERTIDFGKYSGETGSFYIEVKTSDVSKAGTDSNIYLTIYGDKGNTGKINLGTYAQGGNNFEKNDKDCFYIGYDINGIGTINKIEITKDNKGVGPDWHLESIKITEVISNGEEKQSVTFNINQWIEDKTYTFNKSSNTMVTDNFIDRDILKGLTKNEDGSYTLVVNRNINMTHEVFDLLVEEGIILTVKMMNDDDEMIYSLTFDGNQITNHHNIELKKGYSASDGNAIIDFLAGAALPAGTTVAINTELLGFTDSDSLVLLTKNEDGEWNETLKLVNADGIVEFSIEEGKTLLINNGAPLPEDGETESDADYELSDICDFFSRLISYIKKLFNFIIKLYSFLLTSF